MIAYSETLAEVALIVVYGLKKLYTFCRPWIRDRYYRWRVVVERRKLMALYRSTPEGRTDLAASMLEPIRRALEYQAVGRSLLMVDELPQGAMPSRFSNNISITAHPLCAVCGDRTGECNHLNNNNRQNDMFPTSTSATAQELRDTGLIGHMFSEDIYVSTSMGVGNTENDDSGFVNRESDPV